jgi:hypothetical protein
MVEVAFSTDALYFTNLASPGGGLNILKVDLRIFAKVDNRTEIVVEACERRDF